jgi:3-deoxy-D-manno-octulosonic-acid transferase
MYWIYSALLAAALLITLPYWLIQGWRHGKYRAGVRERLGNAPARLLSGTSRAAIWIHAVSVGEVVAMIGLIAELKRRHADLRVVVSTTTDTGQELARREFGEENVFYFPLDFGFAIRPYLRALRPQLFVLAETEFWPNVLRLTKSSGTRVAVVNARISDRSLPGYRRIRFLLKNVLQNVDVFLAQTEEDARRLQEIGAVLERVQVAGNLKFDASVPLEQPIVARLRRALNDANAGPVLVCGSTVEGEEELLVCAFKDVLRTHPAAVMILAPRHPERFGGVGDLLRRENLRFVQRTLWNDEPLAGGVLLLNTIGELAAMYALADVGFVGGSLVRRGGHNVIEAARHGVAIVVGPHTENFRDIVRLFEQHEAVRVVEPEELSKALLELLASDEARAALGRRALETVNSQIGATQRTADALDKLLGSLSAPAGDFFRPAAQVR